MRLWRKRFQKPAAQEKSTCGYIAITKMRRDGSLPPQLVEPVGIPAKSKTVSTDGEGALKV